MNGGGVHNVQETPTEKKYSLFAHGGKRRNINCGRNSDLSTQEKANGNLLVVFLQFNGRKRNLRIKQNREGEESLLG